MTAVASTAPAPGDAYPVQVTFDENQAVNRLWGIPILGYVGRWFALIPHLLVLWFLTIGVGLSLLVSWVLVLVLGRQPLAGYYRIVANYTAQVAGWGLFLAGPYPPFPSGNRAYPIHVEMPTQGPVFRLWGFPYLGLVVRGLLVIPHFFVIFGFSIVAYVLMFVLWIPILLNGRPPRVAFQVLGGLIRLQTRIYVWYLLCPVPYPPLLP